MSSFEPEAFLDAAIDRPLTKRPPAPAGRPLTAVIQKPKIRSWSSEKGGVSRSGYAADIPLEISLTGADAEAVGQDRVVVTDSIFLDVTPSGGLDMSPGKNRGLRRYFEATGLNKPGSSLNSLAGRMLKVVLRHELASDGSGDVYERVDSIAAA